MRHNAYGRHIRYLPFVVQTIIRDSWYALVPNIFSSKKILVELIFQSSTLKKGCSNGWKIPLVFILSCDKAKPTYREIFDILLNHQPLIKPGLIVLDFELAAVNAAKQVFAGTRIQCCNFHLRKNIIHQLAQKGLKRRYETDAIFANEIRMLLALAYVPVDSVIEAFEYFERNSQTLNPVAQSQNENIRDFMTYFVNHYIGKPKKKGGRGKPQFPLDLWNLHESTIKGTKHHDFFYSQYSSNVN